MRELTLVTLPVLLALACTSPESPPSPTSAAELNEPAASASPVPTATPPSISRSATPDRNVPIGTTCPVDERASAGKIGWYRSEDRFCIAWRDQYNDESGFLVVLRYSNSGEEFTYDVGANRNEVDVPEAERPTRFTDPCTSECISRKDFEVKIYALRPSGRELVDGFAVIVG